MQSDALPAPRYPVRASLRRGGIVSLPKTPKPTVRRWVGCVYVENAPLREAGTRAPPSALTSRFVWGVATVSRQSLWALLVPWRCTDPPESPPRHTTPRDGARLRDIRDRHARPRYLSAVARSRMSDHERSRGNPISAWSPPSPHLLAAPRMPPQRIGGRQGCPLEWRLVSLRGWSLALSVGLRRRSGQL